MNHARRAAIAAALTCTVAGALAGCGGGDPEGSDSIGAPTSMAVATQASAPAAEPQQAASPNAFVAPAPPAAAPANPSSPPTQPMSAQSRTADGATVFLTHYVALLNWSYQVADASRITAFQSPDCKACNATAAEISGLAAKKQSIATAPFTVTLAKPGAVTDPYLVRATVARQRTPILDATGTPVGELAASKASKTYVLTWTGLGWQVTDIR